MFSKETYINRRARLMEKINDGIILLLGNSEASANYNGNTYKFRQDSSFLYFFGLDEPDMAAILDVESGEQILFGNDVDIDQILTVSGTVCTGCDQVERFIIICLIEGIAITIEYKKDSQADHQDHQFSQYCLLSVHNQTVF